MLSPPQLISPGGEVEGCFLLPELLGLLANPRETEDATGKGRARAGAPELPLEHSHRARNAGLPPGETFPVGWAPPQGGGAGQLP